MSLLRALFIVVAALIGLAVAPASALEPINVTLDKPALDITNYVELRTEPGDRLQVSTAPGADGVVRRIEVRSSHPGAAESVWLVFALKNNTEEQIDRLLVTPFFRLAGSGLIAPDLGSSRITAISTDQGFAPDRETSQEADVYSITLDPRTVVTFIVELKTQNVPQVLLWEPNAYKDSINSYTLYRGIILGIAGLLALFLSILFVVRGTVMFPAAAGLAWAVLGYLCIDFSFWNRLFRVAAGNDQMFRAGAEVMIATTVIVFLYGYLNLNRWHVSYSHVAVASIVVLLGLLGVAVVDPVLASGIARVLIAGVAVAGAMLIAYLAAHGYDRAFMIIPTWIVFIGWVIAAGLTVTGGLVNDVVQPGLAGGLVLIVMLIAFTVMQHAFAGGSGEGAGVSDVERRALALVGSGDMVWDWDVGRDAIWASPEAEDMLGLEPGSLEGPARTWLEHLHPQDRDRFRSTLDAVVEKKRGRISLSFRLKSEDGQFRWLSLRARPVIGADGEVARCVGTLLDITQSKNTEERLLHDAVHDSLTNLPNREIFLDRVGALLRPKTETNLRAVVLVLDLDRFKTVNDSYGLSVGDSMMLTMARRLARQVRPQDTVARLGSDQFGILLMSEQDPDRIAGFADTLRKALRAPVTFSENEIIVTASIGIAIHDGQPRKEDELVKDAELAMYHSKRLGGDRIEVFRPSLRQHSSDGVSLEADLQRALERNEIRVLFQPIVRVRDERIVGFEALARWDHPKRGRVQTAEFISLAERTGLIIPLGLMVLEKAARQLAQWQQQVPLDPPLFVSVNVSSRQLIRHDLINDIKSVLSRVEIEPGTLKLEVTESLVMENPEYASKVLERIRELGAAIALDDFGTGYSSLSYLQRFTFDAIKVDQQFVRGEGRSRALLLKTIIGLAHDLGMQAIAEGVESEAHVKELRALGCDMVQGYLYGQAMNPEDARRALDRRPRLVAAQ